MKKRIILLLSISLLFISFGINNVHADEGDTFAFEMKIGDKETANAFAVKDKDIIKVNSIGDDLTYWITKVTKNGNEYELINTGNKSNVHDTQGRDVLEVRQIAEGTNYVVVSLVYHAGDDGAQQEAHPDTPEFTINTITFATNDFKGIKLKNSKIPDMFDDITHSNLADLAGTSEENPAVQYIYYGEIQAELAPTDSGVSITSVEVNADSRVATVENNVVKIGSPFYNAIPLKITLNDGTVGYLTLEKIGIEISDYRSDVPWSNHGSQIGCPLPDDGKDKIVATFYYPKEKSYSDYNLIAKLTYANGTIETKVLNGFGETTCLDTTLKGGDFIVWSGTSNKPVEVSVTATNTGNVASDATYAGTLFGSGNGVTWHEREEQ